MTEVPQLTKEHLIALIRQFKQFPVLHRENCWRFLLALPCNEERFEDEVRAYKIAQSQGDSDAPAAEQLILLAKNLTFTLDKAYPISSQTLKNRIHKVALALYRWSPSLAECSWLPKFIFPFIKFYGVSTTSAFETCCCLLKSFEQFFIFRNFMSNRELFIINELLCEWFVLKSERGQAAKQIGKSSEDRMNEFFMCNEQNLPLKNLKSQQEFIFNLFSSFFTEELQGDEWLKLLDHIFVNNKVLFVYILMALFCAREMDLDFRERIDEKWLNLRKIDDLLRAAYAIYHSFNQRQSLDVYDDLLRMNQIKPSRSPNYDEFDRDFPLKQLVTLSFDSLPQQIIMPEMSIRDVKAEVDDVSAVFAERYGKGSQRGAIEGQRRRDAALLEEASEILEKSRASQLLDDSKPVRAKPKGADRLDQGISFGEASILGQAAQQPQKPEEREALAPTSLRDTAEVQELRNALTAEQLAEPEPPKRYSRAADEDLKADELTVPDRPLTTEEIRRNVAKQHANQRMEEKTELQKRLAEVEKDYAERRAQHRTVSDRRVKADVNETADFEEWGQKQRSDRIGASVGATIRSRVKGIRMSKTQSGLQQESSDALRSYDGPVNHDDLYEENREEAQIAGDLREIAAESAKLASTDVATGAGVAVGRHMAGPSGQEVPSGLRQPSQQQQREKKPTEITENQTGDKSTRQNAFEKDISHTSASKLSISKGESQQTPSIMKSSGSKQTTSSTASEKKFPPRQKSTTPFKGISINENIEPASRQGDIVEKLIERHEERKDANAVQELRNASNSSKLTNSPALDQCNSESSLLKSDGQHGQEMVSSSGEQQEMVSRGSEKGDRRFDSPIVQEISIGRTRSSKNASTVSSVESASCDKEQSAKHTLTKEEIDELPVSDNVKRKLYDLESVSSKDERSDDIEELASAQNQEYLNILNNDSFNVDEKIGHLITQIKQNSHESQERILRQRAIEEKMGQLETMNPHIMQEISDSSAEAQEERDIGKQEPQQELAKSYEDEDHMQTVEHIELPQNVQEGPREVSQSSGLQQEQLPGKTIFTNEEAEELTQFELEHPEDILISSMTQTTDSQREAERDVNQLLTEKKLQDGSFGYSMESSVSERPINTDAVEEQYREYSQEERTELPTEEQLVEQIGSMPEYESRENEKQFATLDSSSSSVMTPAKVLGIIGTDQATVSLKEKIDNLELLSEPRNKDIDMSSASLPPPSGSSRLGEGQRSEQDDAPEFLIGDKSSFSESDKQEFDVRQIVEEYLPHTSANARELLENSVSSSSPTAPFVNEEDEHIIDVRKPEDSQNEYSGVRQEAQEKINEEVVQHDANMFSQYDVSERQSNLPPRESAKQDESAISAVNVSRAENAFKAAEEVSSSFDDLDYQRMRYGTGPEHAFHTASAKSTITGDAFSTAASQSETSESNFSTYLKQLQQETKALEERLNLSQKSAIVYNSEREEPGMKIFTSQMIQQPRDVSVNSTATSTVSSYDSDPESFIDSVKMTVQAAKGMREESEELKQGLRGMYEEVQRDLAELESQLGSSE